MLSYTPNFITYAANPCLPKPKYYIHIRYSLLGNNTNAEQYACMEFQSPDSRSIHVEPKQLK
jgi:hypothetical protein